MKENWYDRHILPYLIDLACGIGPVARQREKVVPQARGRVLEIGLGTGRNIPYYDKSRVSRIVGVDPALRMHHLADRRIARSGLNVELIGLSAEKLPAADASFDTVVCTYTLCTIPDPHAALLEMRRVLAPTGKLLYCEHGRRPTPRCSAGKSVCSRCGAKWQVAAIWGAMCPPCCRQRICQSTGCWGQRSICSQMRCERTWTSSY